jgi:NAD(P)-dependent dehydrogenase (short-subunit alcohol dehydrogenase family)
MKASSESNKGRTDFNDRVILITGAGSGIGRQLARTLAGEGALIAGVDLQGEALEKLSVELPAGRSAWAVADVTDRSALRQAVGQLRERLGPVDVLIASAGLGFETSALAYRGEDIETLIRVNLIGVSNGIDAVLPEMIERRRGHLVGLSSLASYRGLPRMAGYCASKAGLNALLDALRVELKPLGIAVTTLCPGWIRTPMTAAVDAPMPGIMEVEDAARRMVEVIRQRRPFLAFPPRSARQVRLLGLLSCPISDWLLGRVLGSLAKKEDAS